MEIRKARKEDFETCIAIARDLPEWFDSKEIQDISNNIIILPSYVLDDEGVQAFIIVENKSNEVIEIKHFAVAKKRQHMGLGTKLIDFIEAEYADKKCIEVKTLDDSADYEPYKSTRSFYEKNGFVKVEVIDPYPVWEPGNPCAVYEKKI